MHDGFCAQEAWHVIALRFFVAMGVGGEWAVASAMVAEVIPRWARVRSLGIFHATSTMGSYLAIAAGLYRRKSGNSDRGDTGSELAAGFWNRRLACIIDDLDTCKIEGARELEKSAGGSEAGPDQAHGTDRRSV